MRKPVEKGLRKDVYSQSIPSKSAEIFIAELKEENWINSLERDQKSGRIISNSSNIELILKNGEFKDVFVFDEFTNQILIKKDLPWINIRKKYERWESNSNPARLMHHLGKKFGVKGREIIENAIIDVARSNSVNQVTERIKGLQWDGQHRIDEVLIDFLGAEDNEYVRKVSRIMFVAAVTRAFNWGCKFDYMVIFVGQQGIRKSSFLEKIAGEFFSSGPDDLKKNKEVGEVLRNAWIVEIAELSAVGKSKSDEVKAFITKREDEYRRAYDRDLQKYPRKCIFVGTTNNRNFLKDETGNRRFWPVDLEKARIKEDFSKLTDEYVNQLWSEAYKYYLDGQKLYLDEQLEEMANVQQENHYDSNPLEGIVENYLNMETPVNWNELSTEHRYNYFKNYEGERIRNREKVCTIEIWSECFGKKVGSFNSAESKKIGELLLKLGWTPGKQKRARFKHYGLQKVYHISEHE